MWGGRLSNDDETFVLCEVFVIFDVAGSQGDAIGEAAGGDPGVVRGTRAPSESRVRGNGAPCGGDVAIAV